MKGILKFDLPEEKIEFDNAIKGSDWKNMVFEFNQHLRSEIKYNSSLSESELEIYEKVQDKLVGLLIDYQLNLD